MDRTTVNRVTLIFVDLSVGDRDTRNEIPPQNTRK